MQMHDLPVLALLLYDHGESEQQRAACPVHLPPTGKQNCVFREHERRTLRYARSRDRSGSAARIIVGEVLPDFFLTRPHLGHDRAPEKRVGRIQGHGGIKVAGVERRNELVGDSRCIFLRTRERCACRNHEECGRESSFEHQYLLLLK
jgi:hypothetical protein